MPRLPHLGSMVLFRASATRYLPGVVFHVYPPALPTVDLVIFGSDRSNPTRIVANIPYGLEVNQWLWPPPEHEL